MNRLSSVGTRYGVLLLLAVGIQLAACTGEKTSSGPTPIRIGWQTAWVPQAQLAMVLKNTKFLESNGLRGEFKSFSYGGPLSEAALADQIDVLFAADQPAINLIARGAKWKIVSKSIYFRDSLLVPVDSDSQTVADLRGKNIAVPFGSGAHRIAIELLTEAGLDAEKDVKLINLDVTEIAAMIKANSAGGGSKVWRGDIAGALIWDPHIAEFEQKKLARVLAEKPLFGVTAMSEKFMQANKAAAASFVRTLQESLFYYALHGPEADNWYAQEVKIDFDRNILRRSASFDQNLKAESIDRIDISFTDADIRTLQNSSDFAFKAGLIKTRPIAKDIVDTDLIGATVKPPKSGS